MEKRREWWLNVYPDGQGWPYEKKEDAERSVGCDGKTIHVVELREGERITSEPELPVPGKTYTNPRGESRRVDKIQIVHGTVEVVYNGGICCSTEAWNAWRTEKPKRKVTLTATRWVTVNPATRDEIVWHVKEGAEKFARDNGHHLIPLTGSVDVEVDG